MAISDQTFDALLQEARRRNGTGKQLRIFSVLYKDTDRQPQDADFDTQRADRLLEAIENSPYTERQVIEQVEKLKNEVRRNLDEMEVLIDQLDDEDRRWFIARAIRTKLGRQGFVRDLPSTLWQRIIDILGEPEWHHTAIENASLRSRAFARLEIAAMSNSVFESMDVEPPVQVWATSGKMFTCPEAAQAYYEFMASQKGE